VVVVVGRGLSILVVENELLIAMDIAKALESAGANATMTTTARHAMILADHDGLAVDHGLTDGDSTAVCARLKERFPYISYSGYASVAGADPAAPFISKPVSMNVLTSALEDLLSSAHSVPVLMQPFTVPSVHCSGNLPLRVGVTHGTWLSDWCD
jgi:DNA-binding response OmpR family regulator